MSRTEEDIIFDQEHDWKQTAIHYVQYSLTGVYEEGIAELLEDLESLFEISAVVSRGIEQIKTEIIATKGAQ